MAPARSSRYAPQAAVEFPGPHGKALRFKRPRSRIIRCRSRCWSAEGICKQKHKQKGKPKKCLGKNYPHPLLADALCWRFEVERSGKASEREQRRVALQELEQVLSELDSKEVKEDPHLLPYKAEIKGHNTFLKRQQHKLQREERQSQQQSQQQPAQQEKEEQGDGAGGDDKSERCDDATGEDDSAQQEICQPQQPHVHVQTQQQHQQQMPCTNTAAGGHTTAPGHPQADSICAGQPGTSSQVHSPSIPASDGQQQGLQGKDKGAHGVAQDACVAVEGAPKQLQDTAHHSDQQQQDTSAAGGEDKDNNKAAAAGGGKDNLEQPDTCNAQQPQLDQEQPLQGGSSKGKAGALGEQEEQVQAGGAGNSQAAAADSNNLWSVWDSQDLKAVELQTRLLGNCTDTTSFKALKAYLMHMRQQAVLLATFTDAGVPDMSAYDPQAVFVQLVEQIQAGTQGVVYSSLILEPSSLKARSALETAVEAECMFPTISTSGTLPAPGIRSSVLPGTSVAIKFPALPGKGAPRSSMSAPDLCKMMLAECRAGELYAHPHIVRVLATAMLQQPSTSGIACKWVPCPVMELMDGDLQGLINSQRKKAATRHSSSSSGGGSEPQDSTDAGLFSTEEAVGLTAPFVEALTYLHSHACVHRDIKPTNIMLARRPGVDKSFSECSPSEVVPKLGDLGVMYNQQLPSVELKGLVGSKGFMAQEVLQGQPPSPKLDVYASTMVFGVLRSGLAPEDVSAWFGRDSIKGSAEAALFRDGTANDASQRLDSTQLLARLRALIV